MSANDRRSETAARPSWEAYRPPMPSCFSHRSTIAIACSAIRYSGFTTSWPWEPVTSGALSASALVRR